MQPRQYSLSDAPGQDRLRISVKREPAGAQTPAGRVSNALHDRLEEGGVLDVAPPQGDFHLKADSDAPVVLLSGGVGLTPMVSILNHLVRNNDERQIRFVHGCRNRSVHAMKDHVNRIAAERGNVRKAVFYEEVGHDDEPGRDYDHAGRLDLRAIRDEVIVPGADYYLCGPAPFMLAQREALLALGVGVTRFWRNVSPGAASGAAVAEAAHDALRLRYLDGGHGKGCNNADDAFTLWRRRFHHFTVYGFMLCFAATCVATLYHYLLGQQAPYPFWSAPVFATRNKATRRKNRWTAVSSCCCS
ncbi:hypothetical protein G6F31_014971 [Rhizopus arrhizus]|nr:hypothetical protein G6F31_014971 [Rhizopus arrhizus]